MARLENRYADALLDLILEQGNLEEELGQAVLVRDTLDSPDIRAFLIHPGIPDTEKFNLISSSFEGQVSERLMGLLSLLIRKGRVSVIIPALTAFIDEGNRRLGRIEARVVSARQLSDSQRDTLHGLMTRKLGKDIRLRTAVDPDLIGGFYILVNGQVFDASIRTELNNMKQQLKRGGSYADQT